MVTAAVIQLTSRGHIIIMFLVELSCMPTNFNYFISLLEHYLHTIFNVECSRIVINDIIERYRSVVDYVQFMESSR